MSELTRGYMMRSHRVYIGYKPFQTSWLEVPDSKGHASCQTSARYI